MSDPQTRSPSDDAETPPPHPSVAPAQVEPKRTDGYQAFDPRFKSPLLASFLSFMPGLGQVYVGYYQRGFAHAAVVATLIALLTAEVLDELLPFAAIFLAFFWLYNIVDAGRRAAFYNQAQAQGEGYRPVELPDTPGLPHTGGSLIGGTALVVVGFSLLLHTRFGISFEWIEDWWPLAPIVLGAYMIWMAIQERRGLATALE